MLADLDDPEIGRGEYQQRPESQCTELSALRTGQQSQYSGSTPPH